MLIKNLVIPIICILVGTVAGVFIQKTFHLLDHETFISTQQKSNQTIETRESGYKYISPLLECDSTSEMPEPNTARIKQDIEKYIQDKEKSRNITIGFYFRDLNNGPWLGINDDATFDPASLLKVPLMMTFLKLSETEPKILNKEILYEGNVKLEQNVNKEDALVPNETYTINDLIVHMIELSDNHAFEELSKHIDFDFVRKLHNDIGVTYPSEEMPENYMTVRSYATLFRVLYNASYLERKTSEQALEYLVNTDFNAGLVAGVPKNIMIAHKFGIRDLNENSDLKQLHDCGIVYHPSRPYLICIMTQGEDLNELTNIIQTISKKVYDGFE